MEPSMVRDVAGIAALALVLAALVSGLKVFLAHKRESEKRPAATHEKQLLVIFTEIGNIGREILYIVRRFDRWLNNK